MATQMETSDDYIYSLDNKNGTHSVVIGDNIKKDWIKLPKELGGKKQKITETIKSYCTCGKHITNIYILEGKYTTMYCNTVKQWAFVESPDEQLKKALRKMQTN